MVKDEDEARYPNENVIRFIAHRGTPARGWGVALDIGSGSGANARALREMGWAVHTLDNNPAAEADYVMDVRGFAAPMGFYDLILDCNALCHVENAPYQKIHDWLDGEGVFFSVHPTSETVPIIAIMGRWTRSASEWDMRESLKMFTNVRVDYGEYPDWRRQAQIKSWIVTAEK